MLTWNAESSLILRRGVHRGIKHFLRDRNMGVSFAGFLGAMLLLQMLLVVFLGTRGITNVLQAETDVRLEILNEAASADVQQLYGSIRALPYVEGARYITREQTFETARMQDPALVSFLEQYNLRNPFSDTISVTLDSAAAYDLFSAFLRQKQWNHVVDPAFLSAATAEKAELQTMLRFSRAGQMFSAFFVLLMSCVVFFLGFSFVQKKVMLRRNELAVEHLVGAVLPGSILPFVVELGMLFLLSVIASTLLLGAVLFAVPSVLPMLGLESVAPQIAQLVSVMSGTVPVFFALEIVLLLALAVGSAWLAIQRQLKPALLFSAI